MSSLAKIKKPQIDAFSCHKNRRFYGVLFILVLFPRQLTEQCIKLEDLTLPKLWLSSNLSRSALISDSLVIGMPPLKQVVIYGPADQAGEQGRQAVWLGGWLARGQAGRQAGKQASKQAGRQAPWRAAKQAAKQAGPIDVDSHRLPRDFFSLFGRGKSNVWHRVSREEEALLLLCGSKCAQKRTFQVSRAAAQVKQLIQTISIIRIFMTWAREKR